MSTCSLHCNGVCRNTVDFIAKKHSLLKLVFIRYHIVEHLLRSFFSFTFG
jgi:hypothetical protein